MSCMDNMVAYKKIYLFFNLRKGQSANGLDCILTVRENIGRFSMTFHEDLQEGQQFSQFYQAGFGQYVGHMFCFWTLN